MVEVCLDCGYIAYIMCNNKCTRCGSKNIVRYNFEYELQDDVESLFKKLGYHVFKEPTVGKQPDLIAVKDREVLIIEVKLLRSDDRTIAQLRDYHDKLKPIFEALGCNVKLVLAGAEYEKPVVKDEDKIKKLSIKIITFKELLNTLREYNILSQRYKFRAEKHDAN